MIIIYRPITSSELIMYNRHDGVLPPPPLPSHCTVSHLFFSLLTRGQPQRVEQESAPGRPAREQRREKRIKKSEHLKRDQLSAIPGRPPSPPRSPGSCLVPFVAFYMRISCPVFCPILFRILYRFHRHPFERPACPQASCRQMKNQKKKKTYLFFFIKKEKEAGKIVKKVVTRRSPDTCW